MRTKSNQMNLSKEECLTTRRTTTTLFLQLQILVEVEGLRDLMIMGDNLREMRTEAEVSMITGEEVIKEETETSIIKEEITIMTTIDTRIEKGEILTMKVEIAEVEEEEEVSLRDSIIMVLMKDSNHLQMDKVSEEEAEVSSRITRTMIIDLLSITISIIKEETTERRISDTMMKTSCRTTTITVTSNLITTLPME